ncbi:MAG: YcnI family protein [Rhodoferax sp.]|nr:YcnI family protein [Rhodoferax sp.]
MKRLFTTKFIATCALLTCGTATFSHVVLGEPAALAGTSYRATLRVGHGCDGSPVTALHVTIPAGFMGAKPMPKPGWVLSLKFEKLAKPYQSHGKTISEDVSEITWTAASKEYWLPDAYYDEFVLRGGLPASAGPMWFKVLQTCEKGSIDWAEVPASGTSTKGLKAPAALLEIIESGAARHSGADHSKH